MNRLREMGQIVNFWSKMTIFWSKNGPKMGKIDFSQNFHWAILVIDHKCSFYKKQVQQLRAADSGALNWVGFKLMIRVLERKKLGGILTAVGAEKKIAQNCSTR